MGRHPRRPDDPIPPSKAQPHGPQIHLHVSAPAWAHLRNQAQLYGYVKPDSVPARGIVNYFTMLTDPRQSWLDTRPAHLIELSTRLLDPAQDHLRRKSTERTATYLFDPDLPPSSPKARPGLKYALWWDPELYPGPRIQHMLVEAQFPLTYYATLALTHGITDPRSSEFQMSLIARASNALEAIGLGSLTPTFELYNPRPFKRETVRIHYFKELEW